MLAPGRQIIRRRQLPEPCHQRRAVRPPPQENRPVLLDDGDLYLDVARFNLASFYRKLVLVARLAPFAKLRHRTQQTARRPWRPNYGSPFHHGLFELPPVAPGPPPVLHPL